MTKFTTSLQQSILILLVMNNEEGKIVANLVSREHFDDPYDAIAAKAIAYHKEFGEAPGQTHIDDIFDDVINNPKHKLRKVYEEILVSIIEKAPGINGKYVLKRVSEFVRGQTLKAAVLEAAERYTQDEEGLVGDVEHILLDALKAPDEASDVGVFLDDKKKALAFLENYTSIFSTGIPELDKIEFGPVRGELLVFMGEKGFGKSWFCVQCGRMALMQRAKLVHISLEMSAERVTQRYFQNFFAIAKRRDKFSTTELEVDTFGNITGFAFDEQRPRFSFADTDIRTILAKRMDDWGAKLGNIVIKQFPNGYLTVDKLRAYLDGLELTHKFIPDMIIVDYPMLMKQNKDEYRLSIGQTFSDLRGLFVERNIAGIAPAQVNREGWGARRVTGKHTAEDGSIQMTADMVLIASQTPAEKALKLARLSVEKARNDRSGTTVLISQNYDTGQFVTSSARMRDTYWNLLKAEGGEDNADTD